MSDAPHNSEEGGNLTEQHDSITSARTASLTVITRFCGRLLVITFFAAVSQNRFSQTFIALLGMIATACIILAVIQREKPFQRHLTNWDEFAAYALLVSLTHALAS